MLVVSSAERAYRNSSKRIRTQYVHITCNKPTSMGMSKAIDFQPELTTPTYCGHCQILEEAQNFYWPQDTRYLYEPIETHFFTNPNLYTLCECGEYHPTETYLQKLVVSREATGYGVRCHGK